MRTIGVEKRSLQTVQVEESASALYVMVSFMVGMNEYQGIIIAYRM